MPEGAVDLPGVGPHQRASLLLVGSSESSESRLYSVFGLTVESELPLPELPPGDGPADVHVRFAPVEGPDREGWYWSASQPGSLRLEIPETGRFEVSRGEEIRIDRHPDAAEGLVRLYLLGTAFGVLLHQRGLLALHGSTVVKEGRCISILGDSGAGKSTAAASLTRRGYKLMSDDVSATDVRPDGSAWVSPAYPQHKLHMDACRSLALAAETYPRVVPEEDKRIVRTDRDFAGDPHPLAAIVVLERGKDSEPTLRSVRGARKLSLLIEHTYRAFLLGELKLLEPHFRLASAVAAAVPVHVLVRPEETESLEQVADLIDGVHASTCPLPDTA